MKTIKNAGAVYMLSIIGPIEMPSLPIGMNIDYNNKVILV